MHTTVLANYTRKNYELLKVFENRTEQCCAAHIVQCCQQYWTSCWAWIQPVIRCNNAEKYWWQQWTIWAAQHCLILFSTTLNFLPCTINLSFVTKGSTQSNDKSQNKKVESFDEKDDVDLRETTTFQRKRTSFSRLQQRMLEAKFQRAPYLTIQERNNLANFLELNSRQVKVWFQNRRNKWKRENRGQLLIQPSLEMKSFGSAFALENCFSCVMYNPYAHLYLKCDK